MRSFGNTLLATVGIWALSWLVVGPGLAWATGCTTSYYVPAHFTNGAAGDVSLAAAQNGLIQGLSQQLGMTYGHAAVLYDASGNRFTETYANSNTPPSSNSTGEPHICSRVISPYYLQRLSPGVVNGGARDAVAGVLVKGGARAACVGVGDSYHIYSIKNRIHGGSCAAFAEDDCGAQVTGGWQRVFSPAEHYTAAIFLYTATYNQCTGVINSFWPWGGIGCGGVSATGMCYGGNCSACDRAASQVVNEFAMQAFTNDDGWSSYNGCPPGSTNFTCTSNELLGNAKTNFQPTGWWTNNSASWTPRIPDNIYASAGPNGHAIVGSSVAAGYWVTNRAPDDTPCGACDSGYCYNGVCTGATGCGGGCLRGICTY
jgi:hypothetical protein